MHTLLSILLRLTLVMALWLSPFPAAVAAPAQKAYPDAQATLPQVEASVVTATGRTHRFRLEVAASGEEKERGLMFRTALAADEGMLFLYGESLPRYMWMKNTLIPLDMLFLDAEGRILHLHPGAQPHSLEPVGARLPIRSVVELQGGISEKLGIRIGDVLRIDSPLPSGRQP